MQLTVLGSGGFEPGERGSSSIAFQAGKTILLVDAGRNSFNQFKKAGLKYKRIKAILLTHWHPDHASELIAFLHWFHATRKKPLTIIGPKGTKKSIKALLKAFPNVSTSYGLKVVEKPGLFTFNDIKVRAFKTVHVVPSIAFQLKVKDRKIVFAGDSDECQSLIRESQAADLLVLCFHVLKSKTGKLAQKCQVKKLLVIHFEPNNKMPAVKKKIKRYFKGRLFLAKDLMKVKI